MRSELAIWGANRQRMASWHCIFTSDFHLFLRFSRMFHKSFPYLRFFPAIYSLYVTLHLFPMMFRTFHHIIFAWSFSNFSCAFVHFPQFSHNFHSFPMCLPIYSWPFPYIFGIFSQFSHGFAIFFNISNIFPIYFAYLPHILYAFSQGCPCPGYGTPAFQARDLAPASSKLPGPARCPPLAPAAQGGVDVIWGIH